MAGSGCRCLLKSGNRSTGGCCGLAAAAVEAGALNISAARSRGLSAWDFAGGGRGQGIVGLWLGAEKASGCQRPGGLSGLVFKIRKWEAGRSVGPVLGPMLGRGLGGKSPGADRGLGTSRGSSSCR